MRVLVFTKYPRPGMAKTRLGAEIGFDRAAALQEAFVRDELNTLAALGADVTVYCDPMERPAEYRRLFGTGPGYRAQRGADLGERMLGALHEALAQTPGGVVLVGSDLPDLPASHVTAAFRTLEESPVCFGPAPDGGFHLIGLSAPLPGEVFASVRWGEDDVLARAVANCASLGLTPAFTPSWPDVDTLADLREYAIRNACNPTHTMACIHAHGLLDGTWKR